MARWHIARANSARDGHNWLKARSHYSRALALTPGRADIWVQLGHAEKESGALREAGEAYDRAIALQPHVADTHLQIGHLRKLQGDLDAAAQSYTRAFQLDQTLSNAAAEIQRMGRTPPKTDAERISALEAGVSSMDGRTEALEAGVSSMDGRMLAFEALILSTRDTVLTLEASISSTGDLVARHADRLATLCEAVENLGGALAAHQERAVSDSRILADVMAGFGQLGARVDILAERSTVATQFAFELSSTRSILGKAFERLALVEQALAAFKEETQALVLTVKAQSACEPASNGGVGATPSNVNSNGEDVRIAAYS